MNGTPEIVLPISCFQCHEKIKLKSSVLFSCDCLITICQECAKDQLKSRINVLDGVQCPCCQAYTECSIDVNIAREVFNHFTTFFFRRFELTRFKKKTCNDNLNYTERFSKNIIITLNSIVEFQEINCEFIEEFNKYVETQTKSLPTDEVNIFLARIELSFQQDNFQFQSTTTVPHLNDSIFEIIQILNNITLETALYIPPYEQEITLEDSCISCAEKITTGKSVLMLCSCKVSICQDCARKSVINYENTYHNKYILCPFCKKETKVLENVENAMKKENELLILGYQLSEKVKPLEGNITYHQIMGLLKYFWGQGICSSINPYLPEGLDQRKLNSKYTRLEVARMALRYSELQQFRNKTGAGGSSRDFWDRTLPLGPIELLRLKRNCFLEAFVEISQEIEDDFMFGRLGEKDKMSVEECPFSFRDAFSQFFSDFLRSKRAVGFTEERVKVSKSDFEVKKSNKYDNDDSIEMMVIETENKNKNDKIQENIVIEVKPKQKLQIVKRSEIGISELSAKAVIQNEPLSVLKTHSEKIEIPKPVVREIQKPIIRKVQVHENDFSKTKKIDVKNAKPNIPESITQSNGIKKSYKRKKPEIIIPVLEDPPIEVQPLKPSSTSNTLNRQEQRKQAEMGRVRKEERVKQWKEEEKVKRQRETELIIQRELEERITLEENERVNQLEDDIEEKEAQAELLRIREAAERIKQENEEWVKKRREEERDRVKQEIEEGERVRREREEKWVKMRQKFKEQKQKRIEKEKMVLEQQIKKQAEKELEQQKIVENLERLVLEESGKQQLQGQQTQLNHLQYPPYQNPFEGQNDFIPFNDHMGIDQTHPNTLYPSYRTVETVQNPETHNYSNYKIIPKPIILKKSENTEKFEKAGINRESTFSLLVDVKKHLIPEKEFIQNQGLGELKVIIHLNNDIKPVIGVIPGSGISGRTCLNGLKTLLFSYLDFPGTICNYSSRDDLRFLRSSRSLAYYNIGKDTLIELKLSTNYQKPLEMLIEPVFTSDGIKKPTPMEFDDKIDEKQNIVNQGGYRKRRKLSNYEIACLSFKRSYDIPQKKVECAYESALLEDDEDDDDDDEENVLNPSLKAVKPEFSHSKSYSRHDNARDRFGRIKVENESNWNGKKDNNLSKYETALNPINNKPITLQQKVSCAYEDALNDDEDGDDEIDLKQYSKTQKSNKNLVNKDNNKSSNSQTYNNTYNRNHEKHGSNWSDNKKISKYQLAVNSCFNKPPLSPVKKSCAYEDTLMDDDDND